MEATEQETTEQAVEQPQTDPLKEVLSRINERDSEESPVVEDADTAEPEQAVEETPQEPAPEPVKVEGPSVAMKTLAKQYGVDEDIIALVKSDEQLRPFIEKAAQSRDTKPEPEPEPEKAFELEWPEGEFDADDPVRKNLTKLQEHFSKKFDEAYGYLNRMAEMTLAAQKELEESKQSRQVADEIEFDDFLDTLNAPALGNRAKGDLSDLAQGFRQAMYYKFKDEEAKNPRATRKALLEQVAQTAGFATQEQAKQAAIKAANSQRLGGAKGNAQPVPPKELSGLAAFKAKLAEINARPHNKEH